jgi:hypothetical protein
VHAGSSRIVEEVVRRRSSVSETITRTASKKITKSDTCTKKTKSPFVLLFGGYIQVVEEIWINYFYKPN